MLALIGQGRSNTEIAALLGISMNTTKLHVAAVLRRLRLDNRMQAVALGARLPDRRLAYASCSATLSFYQLKCYCEIRFSADFAGGTNQKH